MSLEETPDPYQWLYCYLDADTRYNVSRLIGRICDSFSRAEAKLTLAETVYAMAQDEWDKGFKQRTTCSVFCTSTRCRGMHTIQELDSPQNLPCTFLFHLPAVEKGSQRNSYCGNATAVFL